MVRTTIAEILRAKDPLRFGKLVGYLLERGLLDPASVRGRRSSRRRAIQGRQRRRGRVVFSVGALRSGLRPTPLAG
jgi:hypothetical protein